jgi:hypothetical protein
MKPLFAFNNYKSQCPNWIIGTYCIPTRMNILLLKVVFSVCDYQTFWLWNFKTEACLFLHFLFCCHFSSFVLCFIYQIVTQIFCITLKLKCTLNSLACLLAYLHSTLHLEKPLVLCNKNQLDELFILSLFRQSTSACFGHIFIPSSGGILYIYNNWYVLCFSVDCLLAGLGWNSVDWRKLAFITQMYRDARSTKQKKKPLVVYQLKKIPIF